MRTLFASLTVLTLALASTTVQAGVQRSIYEFFFGPARDMSRFDSAVLDRERNRLYFTYHDFSYLGPTGLEAFGIYPRDRSVLVRRDLDSGEQVELAETRNAYFKNGVLIVTPLKPSLPCAVLGHAVTIAKNPRIERRWIHFTTGRTSPFPDLDAELARHGRRAALSSPIGPFHPLDCEGNLLVAATAPGLNETELWYRTSQGELTQLDSLEAFYGSLGFKIFYFNTAKEAVLYDLMTGERNVISRYEGNLNRVLIAHHPDVDAIRNGTPKAGATTGLDIAPSQISLDGKPVPINVQKIKKALADSRGPR